MAATWAMDHARRTAAPLALTAVVLFPIVPWLLAGPLQERVAGSAAFHAIANLAGFLAIAAWAANLVLASRLGPIERAFGGLERLYRMHRRVGELVVALALVHVVFLALHRGSGALELFLPSAGWAVFSGVVAIVLLVGLVGISRAGRVGYPRFIIVQRLLGAVFIVGALHSLAIRGTAASSTALTLYLVALTAAGAGSLGLRLAGSGLGITRRHYRVDAAHHLDPDVIEVVLTPVGRPLEFRPGQFVYVTFDQPGIRRESHPFTIAGGLNGPVRIVIKRLGDHSARLMRLRAGAKAWLEGPFGSFHPADDPLQAQTWVAGGIGITPFLSWARALDPATPVDLYYCTPGSEQAHFLDELFAIADRNPRFRVIPIRKDSLGHLGVEDLAAVNPHVLDGHVFICGPQAMIENLRAGLGGWGMAPDRIHAERFDFR